MTRVSAGDVLAAWFAREVASAPYEDPSDVWSGMDLPWWDADEREVIRDALTFVESLRGVLAWLSGTEPHDDYSWHACEAEHFLGLETEEQ